MKGPDAKPRPGQLVARAVTGAVVATMAIVAVGAATAAAIASIALRIPRKAVNGPPVARRPATAGPS